jgi:3-phosphoglycerate kinase
MFEAVLETPELPFLALFAGTRIDEKLPVLEHLLPRLNCLCFGGILACTFLKAQGEAWRHCRRCRRQPWPHVLLSRTHDPVEA